MKAMRDGTTSLKVSFHRCLNLNTDIPILFQDRLVFWGALILHPVVWGLFFVMNAITIKIFDVRFKKGLNLNSHLLLLYVALSQLYSSMASNSVQMLILENRK